MSEELYHYGTPRHSGRYPWGSGDNPYQHMGNGTITARYRELEAAGMTSAEIAKNLNMSTGELRSRMAIEREAMKNQQYFRTVELKNKGYSNTKIAEMLGVTEGTIRNNLKKADDISNKQIANVADQLAKAIEKNKYIDVGAGAEYALNCKDTKLDAAITLLREGYGYEYHAIKVKQLGTDHDTTMTILCPPGTEKKTLYNNLDKIHQLDESRRIDVNGDVKVGVLEPRSVDRKRIYVRYAEDGGADKDGTIELRRGVDDISLGKAHYAQVRIAVDDKAYMKGMAFYSDNIPPGYDIIYNSNKKRGTDDYGDGGVFKELKIGKDNPFGATIKGANDPTELKLCQREYLDKDGKTQLSCINVVNEEGTWDTWSKSLSSQFLSKQPVPLAERQLDLATKQTRSKLDDILKLTEPTVKRQLLIEFADECDAAAAELKAAALPRQRSQVILPVTSLKDNEVYAPNFKTGEHVCLVRHPHAGVFEIPELVVNNNNKEGKSVLGKAPDAIGINVNVAKKLSGADFDGDSVLVLPSDNVRIKSSKDIPSNKNSVIKSLQDFDPNQFALPNDTRINSTTGKKEYVYPTITNKRKQALMGQVSNLITDMTLKGAPIDEIIRADKHSMVVIDSEKHRLDYKASEEYFGINALKAKWQGGTESRPKGASTIVSRAKSEYSDLERKQWYARESKVNKETGRRTSGIDPVTGEKVYEYTGHTYEKVKKVKDDSGKVVDYVPTGKIETRRTKTTKMAMTKDATTLTSDGKGGYPMEAVYARYANTQKSIANQARKEALTVKDREYVPSAAKTYAKEVASLDAKLLLAKKNAPRERAAILLANSKIKAEVAADPSLKDDADRLKKVRGQALSSSRVAVGAKKDRIAFTDREWEAIQSGAIRKTKLKEILNNANKDDVKQRAMPKNNTGLNSTTKSTIKAMANRGYTQAEIAEALGISTSTVSNVLN